MISAPLQESRKRKIKPGTWWLIALVVLLLISRAVLAYFDDAWQWEGRLADETRLARAAGMYVTEADFLAAYQAPADPAANELLRDLMALPVVRETGVQDLGRLRRLLKRGTLAEREEVLRTYAAVLPLAEGLARQNRLFRPEILTVVQPRSRHHLTLQVAGHILLHRAMVNDGKGKVAEAEIEYARVARVAQVARQPPPSASGGRGRGNDHAYGCLSRIGTVRAGSAGGATGLVPPGAAGSPD